MSTRVSWPGRRRVANGLLAALAAPVRLATYRHLLYLGLLYPLGLGYFIAFTVGLSVGAGLVVLFGVGVLVLLPTLAVARGVAWLERKQLTVLLDRDVAQPALWPPRGEDSGTDGPDGERKPDAATPATEASDTPADGEPPVDTEGGAAEGGGRSVTGFFRALYLDWSLPLEVIFLFSKFAWGVVAFVLAVSAGSTTASFLAVLLYYDAPGAVVGVVPRRSTTVAGGLTVPWGDVAVGARTVIRLTGWSVDTFPEALAFAGIGVLFGVFALNVLVWFSRLAAWWAELWLDAGTPAAIGDRLARFRTM